jgi:hypothetical protein
MRFRSLDAWGTRELLCGAHGRTGRAWRCNHGRRSRHGCDGPSGAGRRCGRTLRCDSGTQRHVRGRRGRRLLGLRRRGGMQQLGRLRGADRRAQQIRVPALRQRAGQQRQGRSAPRAVRAASARPRAGAAPRCRPVAAPARPAARTIRAPVRLRRCATPAARALRAHRGTRPRAIARRRAPPHGSQAHAGRRCAARTRATASAARRRRRSAPASSGGTEACRRPHPADWPCAERPRSAARHARRACRPAPADAAAGPGAMRRRRHRVHLLRAPWRVPAAVSRAAARG